jgi:predicted RNA-binding Zn ribbon-like protein
MPSKGHDQLETRAFALLGEPLAVDLVNTIAQTPAGAVDLLATTADRDAWLVAHPTLPVAPAGQRPSLEQLRALRDALARLFAAALDSRRPPEAGLALLNELSARAAEYDQIAWPRGGDPARRVASTAAIPADAILAELARSGIDVLTGPNRERLRRCQAPGCVLIFVAEHPQRRWCSPATCGNRVRAARHYRRQRA